MRSILFDEATKEIATDSSAVILSISFTAAIMYGALISPAFPGIVSDVSGATSTNVGLVLTIQTAVIVLFLPITGVIAGRVGPRRILIPSLFFYGLLGVVTAFASNFDQLLVIRAIQGVAYTGIIPMVTTLVSQLFTGEQEVSAQGLLSITTGIAGVLYPVIGGQLAEIGWRIPFLFYGAFIPVSIVAYFSIDEVSSTGGQKATTYLKDVTRYFRSPIHLASFSWGFTIFFLRLVIISYLPLLAVRQFGASAGTIGVLIASIGLIKTVSAGQITRILQNVPIQKHFVVVCGVILASSSVMFLSVSTTFWTMFVVLSLFGISYGISLPLNRSLITLSTPTEFRSATFASLSLMNNLGKTVAPVVVGGLIALRFEIELVFILIGFITIISTLSISVFAYVLKSNISDISTVDTGR